MEERVKLIGLIHRQKAKAMVCDSCGRIFFSEACPDCRKNAHRMKDEEYRSFLMFHAGKASCSQMDELEMKMIVTAFDDAGWKDYWKRQKASYMKRRTQTIQIIKREAERVLGDSWAERLQGFIDKVIGKSSIYMLDETELRNVIGWLRRLKKSEARKTKI